MTESTQKLVRSIFSKTSIFTAVVTIILAIAILRDISYALGFLFGSIAAMVNFYLLSYSTDNLLSGNAKSRLYYPFFYTLRLGLAGVIIWRAITSDGINLFTTILGLLAVKIVITLEAVIKHFFSKMKTYGV